MAKLKCIAAFLLACDAAVGFLDHQRPLRHEAGGQEAPRSPFTAAFKDYAEGIMMDWKVPGVSIAVVDGDEVFAEVCTHNVALLFVECLLGWNGDVLLTAPDILRVLGIQFSQTKRPHPTLSGQQDRQQKPSRQQRYLSSSPVRTTQNCRAAGPRPYHPSYRQTSFSRIHG